MHPDRNAACESFRKMVARQRERSRRGVRERRAQGVERLGVILSRSPCPPRRFARHAWVCRERWGRLGSSTAPPGRTPSPSPASPAPRPGSPSRLSLPSLAAGGGRQEQREAHPTEEEQGGVTLQPCCGLRQP